jgi:glycerophosphoryl diester phosphodiesterase
MSTDPLYDALLAAYGDSEGRALASRYAPVLRFDREEPFLPLAAGYTIFSTDAPSPSFPRTVTLRAPDHAPAHLAIEYAIWWDWDINHLYELEHVWVYVNEAGQVVHAEASWHGGLHPMRHGGILPLQDDHVVLCSEPGKHAIAPDPGWYAERMQPHPRSVSRELAGLGGLLVTDLFKGAIRRTPLADTLSRTYLARCAFTPSLIFERQFAFTPEQLVPWEALCAWVPQRIEWVLEGLARDIPPSEYRPLRIGHRGAAGHAPDNTLAGIEVAARLGADAVEIDVQLTRDGIPVASHDSALHDVSGHAKPISELSLADMQRAHPDVPTIEQVVAHCRAQRIGLYLELKDGSAIRPMLEVLKRQSFGSVTIGSFRPDWLADVKAAAPNLPTSVLFGAPAIDACLLAAAAGAEYVHPCWERRSQRPDQLLTAEWIAKVRDAGLGIITWHEERPEVIAGLRSLGVDGICSDRPELLSGP